MPHSFFILARLFVRVDNVLFRIYDVRIYHAFGSEEVIREVSGMEAGYDTVKQVCLSYVGTWAETETLFSSLRNPQTSLPSQIPIGYTA